MRKRILSTLAAVTVLIGAEAPIEAPSMAYIQFNPLVASHLNVAVAERIVAQQPEDQY